MALLSKNDLSWLLFTPLSEQRKRVAWVVFSLFMLSVAQAVFVYSAGPLLKGLFSNHAKEFLVIKDLLEVENAPSILDPVLGIEIRANHLIFIAPLMMFAAGVMRAFSIYIYQFNQQVISLHVARKYREKLFDSIIGRNFSSIIRKSPAEWMSNIMNDVYYLQHKLSDVLSGFLKDGVTVFVLLVVLFFLNWKLALVILAIFPFVGLFLGQVGKVISFYAEEWQKRLGYIAGFILGIRRRFVFIVSQMGESIEVESFSKLNRSYYEMIRRSVLIRSAASPLLEFVSFFVFASFVFFIGKGALGPDFSGTKLLQYVIALGLILKPLKNIGEQFSRYKEVMGALNESFLTIRTSTAQVLRNDEISAGVQVVGKSLTIESLSWSAEDHGVNKSILEIEDLNLPDGKMIAIVGASGAGKSSFLKILAGVIEPDKYVGSILLEEIRIRASYVSQIPFLFEGSLLENLFYPQEVLSLTEENILRARELLNVFGLEELDSKNLDIQVNPLSENVSGGQKQRLALCRALLRNKQILLLDEATSALDAKSEESVYCHIKDLVENQGITVVAITHRYETLTHFDHVIEIESGKNTHVYSSSEFLSKRKTMDGSES